MTEEDDETYETFVGDKSNENDEQLDGTSVLPRLELGGSIGEDEDYYDDENDQGDEERMYKEACSVSKFMVNPCYCIFTSISTLFHRHCCHCVVNRSKIRSQQRHHQSLRERDGDIDNIQRRKRRTFLILSSRTIKILVIVFGLLICVQIWLHIVISSSSTTTATTTTSPMQALSTIEDGFEHWWNKPKRKRREAVATTSRERKQQLLDGIVIGSRHDGFWVENNDYYQFQILMPTFSSHNNGNLHHDIGGWISHRHFDNPDTPVDRFRLFGFDDETKLNADAVKLMKEGKIDILDGKDGEISDKIGNHGHKKAEKKSKKKKKKRGKDDEQEERQDDTDRETLRRTAILNAYKVAARPDYGGINYTPSIAAAATTTSSEKSLLLSSASKAVPAPRRLISIENNNDAEISDAERKGIDDRNHALDEEEWDPDDLYLEHDEDIEDFEQNCYRPAFKNKYHPTCNAVHELDLGRDYISHPPRHYHQQSRSENSDDDDHYDGIDFDNGEYIDDQTYDTFYISHGYFRDVWVVYQPDFETKTILKTLRWKHEVSLSMTREVLNDALIMERMTASPRIVDIFHHCGTSVWVEAINYEVEEVIVPGEGYYELDINNETMTAEEQQKIRDEFPMVEDIVTSSGEMLTVPKPFNDFTAVEKLDMALQMAKSLADLHGYEGGVIVHDDVQLCQWLRTKNGRIKLGDFNRAEIMDYDPMKKQYCKYNNGHGHGNYRAPEEFAGEDLNEQIDVFSFGNNIYGLITGLWVFYDDQDYDSVQARLVRGERAYIDPKWSQRSVIESRLIEIIKQCWLTDPSKRIDIFRAVRQLQDLWDETQGKRT